MKKLTPEERADRERQTVGVRVRISAQDSTCGQRLYWSFEDRAWVTMRPRTFPARLGSLEMSAFDKAARAVRVLRKRPAPAAQAVTAKLRFVHPDYHAQVVEKLEAERNAAIARAEKAEAEVRRYQAALANEEAVAKGHNARVAAVNADLDKCRAELAACEKRASRLSCQTQDIGDALGVVSEECASHTFERVIEEARYCVRLIASLRSDLSALRAACGNHSTETVKAALAFADYASEWFAPAGSDGREFGRAYRAALAAESAPAQAKPVVEPAKWPAFGERVLVPSRDKMGEVVGYDQTDETYQVLLDGSVDEPEWFSLSLLARPRVAPPAEQAETVSDDKLFGVYRDAHYRWWKRQPADSEGAHAAATVATIRAAGKGDIK